MADTEKSLPINSHTLYLNATKAFGLSAYPENMVFIKNGFEDFSQEARLCLISKNWNEIINPMAFSNLDKYNIKHFDPVNIVFSISRDCFKYFLPGLLLYFIYNYKNFHNLECMMEKIIIRLQFDCGKISNFGNIEEYFEYDINQKKSCIEMLQFLNEKYGDDYSDVDDSKFENSIYYQCSISRVLRNFWIIEG